MGLNPPIRKTCFKKYRLVLIMYSSLQNSISLWGLQMHRNTGMWLIQPLQVVGGRWTGIATHKELHSVPVTLQNVLILSPSPIPNPIPIPLCTHAHVSNIQLPHRTLFTSRSILTISCWDGLFLPTSRIVLGISFNFLPLNLILFKMHRCVCMRAQARTHTVLSTEVDNKIALQ